MSLSFAGSLFDEKPRRVSVITALALANRTKSQPPAQVDQEERRAMRLVELQRELDGVPGIGSSAVAGEQAVRARRATGRLT